MSFSSEALFCRCCCCCCCYRCCCHHIKSTPDLSTQYLHLSILIQRTPPTSGFQEGSRRGCQDARDLLRYEAVTLEEALHHTLVEVNESQGLLEEGRVQAATR